MGETEDYEGRRLAAYHEASHAIAAIKCPDGRVEYIDICDRNVNDAENGATQATCRDADEAFYIYAGPWLEAKLRALGGPVTPDEALTSLRANRDDWIAFQYFVGNDVDISAWTAMQESLLGLGDPISPEYRPPRLWHEKAAAVLEVAWNDGEIQQLAEQMLAHKVEIELSNGQRLIREEQRDRWHGTDYRKAPDGGSGLIGLPSPIQRS